MENINWEEITTAPDFNECFNDKEIKGKIVNVFCKTMLLLQIKKSVLLSMYRNSLFAACA